LFAVVHNRLQNSQFASTMFLGCSPPFVWVGVLLV
jgi:hypothetical protein